MPQQSSFAARLLRSAVLGDPRAREALFVDGAGVGWRYRLHPVAEYASCPGMSNEPGIDSLRSKLDEFYEWPALYPFKFIVPKGSVGAVRELFADDPVQERESRNGRFVSLTMEMHMHSGDEVIAIYQRVARIPGVISL